MSNKGEKILRQSRSNRFVHWGAAVSIFLLIITGLGQLPLYKRYNVTNIPGAEWLGSFFTTLDLHYIGAAGLLFVVFYHLVYHLVRKEFDIMPRKGDMKESYFIIKAMLTKGKEPDSDKYLAEQRIAYLFIGVNVLLLVFSGLIKVIKNVPDVVLPSGVVFWATQIHNLATVLLIFGLVGHFAAFLIKENRKLIPGMFTGYVDKEYVKHRHSLWYARIKEEKETSKPAKINLSHSQKVVGH
ncbi:MAG: cytochrome b/b6 domain-containing protein [Desulfitobacterium hafniense]|nr:cytochrome b/b6 domain-containing protein [Desulfitobacterium hafniense]